MFFHKERLHETPFWLFFDFSRAFGEEISMNCRNCQTPTEGKYCPHCGQKTTVRDLTVSGVASDFLLAVTNTERGLLKTIIDLSQRPGEMIHNYIQGQRVCYFSAGKYALMMLVLFTLTLSLLENRFGSFQSITNLLNEVELHTDTIEEKAPEAHSKKEKTKISSKTQIASDSTLELTFRNDPKKGTVTIAGQDFEKTVTQKRLVQFIKSMVPLYHQIFFDYLRIFSILWIPLFSLLTFFFFRKAGHNFAHHITFNTYVFSHMLFICVALAPLFWIFPDRNEIAAISMSLAAFFFMAFSFFQFFSTQPRILLKTAATLGLGLPIYVASLISLMLGLAIYVGYSHLDQI